MRKLAIVGYGKMGKLIEQLAPEYDFQVALKLDEFNNPDGAGLTAANFQGVDVAIEFSIPAVVPGNVEGIAALGVPLVVGTTGWLEHIDRVKRAIGYTTETGGRDEKGRLRAQHRRGLESRRHHCRHPRNRLR